MHIKDKLSNCRVLRRGATCWICWGVEIPESQARFDSTLFFIESKHMRQEELHIGQHIRQIMRLRGVTVTSLAATIGTTRTNMHKILRKRNIDIVLLERISKALQYDFFLYLSENTTL